MIVRKSVTEHIWNSRRAETVVSLGVKGDRHFTVVFKPEERSSLLSVSMTQNYLLLNKLNNVKGELFKCTFANGQWENQKVDAPDCGTLSVISTDKDKDQYFFSYENFLEPKTL